MIFFVPARNNVGINALVDGDLRLGRTKVFDKTIITPVAISENGYIAIYNAGGRRRHSTAIPFWFRGETVQESLAVIHVNSIIGIELHIDNKSGLGGAVLGGLIAGGGGMIVGQSYASKKIKCIDLIFKVNDFDSPKIVVPLHNIEGGIARFGIDIGPIFIPLLLTGKGADKKAIDEAYELVSQLEMIIGAKIT